MCEGVYLANYWLPDKSVREVIDEAIDALPRKCVVFSSSSLIDELVVQEISQKREVTVVRLRTDEIKIADVIEWAGKHREKYFLTDPQFATILFEAERLSNNGENVVIIGPVPQVSDNSWSFSSEFPMGRKLFLEPQWAIIEWAKNGSLTRMCAKNPRIHSLLNAQVMLAYLREVDFLNRSVILQEVGIKHLGGNTIGRFLKQQSLFAESVGVLPLSKPLADQLAKNLLNRSFKANRCMLRVERYVN